MGLQSAAIYVQDAAFGVKRTSQSLLKATNRYRLTQADLGQQTQSHAASFGLLHILQKRQGPLIEGPPGIFRKLPVIKSISQSKIRMNAYRDAGRIVMTVRVNDVI